MICTDYLIFALAINHPEAIVLVDDNCITVDASISRETITDIEMQFQRMEEAIDQIVFLQPTDSTDVDIEADYTKSALIAKTMNQVVHIARPHLIQDSKSSEMY